MAQEMKKNDENLAGFLGLNGTEQKVQTVHKQLKRDNNGRWQKVENQTRERNGRKFGSRAKDLDISPGLQKNHSVGRRSRDILNKREMSLDQDDEICEKCHRKYLENYEHVEHQWIGCDNCGKWFHVECMLTKQQHDKLQA